MLSPTNVIVMNSSLFSGYYDNYVNQVWQMYTSATLSVDTQASSGTVTGQVTGGALTFPGVGSFGQPAAADIFGCNSGTQSDGMSAEMLAILARLAAAFNRSTLLIDSDQPDGENPSDYYANASTNHYARIVHATTLDHRSDPFPYDDVAPTGGADQSGAVSSGSPSLLTVTLGPVTDQDACFCLIEQCRINAGRGQMAVEFQAEDFVLAGPGLEAPQQDGGLQDRRIRSCVPGFELRAQGGRRVGSGSGPAVPPAALSTVRRPSAPKGSLSMGNEAKIGYLPGVPRRSRSVTQHAPGYLDLFTRNGPDDRSRDSLIPVVPQFRGMEACHELCVHRR